MTDHEWFGDPGGEPVVLVGWRPDWEKAFELWRSRLSDALGPVAVGVEHIGSTAVPRLAAKPVIDVLVTVADIAEEPGYRPAIELLGLPLRGRAPAHRFFRPPAGQPRTVHVHVCQAGGQWERDHLLFRDYLRAHRDEADSYQRLKRRLVQEVGGDRGRYTDAKGAFIADVLVRAAHWAMKTDWGLS